MAENLGYISLHRQIRDHWIWKDPVKFQWFVDMLMEVNHQSTKVLIGNQLFDCERGQSLNSLLTWAKRWGTSKDSTRNFLELLRKDNMILVENLKKTTRITICNYDTYQSSLHAGQTQGKRKANARQTQGYPNNNDNNENNENNEKEIREDKSSLVDKSTSEVMKSWNNFCSQYGFNPIRSITGKRRTALKERIRDNKDFLLDFQKALECILQSDFCRGNNERGWIADFDWLMRPDTVTKLLEGKYSKNKLNSVQIISQIPSQSQSLWDDKPTDTPEQREINAKVRAEKENSERRRQAYELRKQLSNN